MARMSARKLGEISFLDDAALLAAEANPYSTLPAAGNRMFESAYNRHIAEGESKKAAAIHAWMHVKHYYVQDPVTKKWKKRKKPLPFSASTKRRRTNPRKGVTQNMALVVEEGAKGALTLVLFDKKKLLSATDTEKDAVNVIYGILAFKPNWRCKGAFEIEAAAAAKGYGPLLYDLGMTLAQERGAPGVIPDRDKVSDAAAKVWEYASKRRTDLQVDFSGVLCPSHGRGALDQIYSIEKPFPQTKMLLRRGNEITLRQADMLQEMIFYFWKCMYFGSCPTVMPKRIEAVAGGPQKNPRHKKSKKRTRKKNPTLRSVLSRALR